ncbi:hypothetical protein IJG98_01945 [Candidatus Saccharibacteria bacterium]|nr:hypothetical protein [Candidatus Saccharibacteria bacterium]
MKTSDYVTVGFVAILVTAIAYFAVNSILGDPKTKTVRFEYLSDVETTLSTPNAEVFNAAAVNPTVEVYIGSCVDQDQDGILNEQERKDCGMDAMETDTGQTESDYLIENGGLSNEENNAINNQEGFANGTTAEQRQAVSDDVNEYQQQQQTNANQNTINDAARQETVSGS